MVSDLVVDMLIGTLLIYKINRGIFPSERDVDPRHSHLVAILSTSEHQKSTSSTETALISKGNLSEYVETLQTLFRVARQMVF